MRLPKGRRLIRVAAPVFAVGLVVLLTAIPAYAVVPTVTSITPASPAPGCSATLTGANFQLPANGGPVTTLTFAGQPPVAPAVTDSDSQLEVTVPAALLPSTATTVIAHNTTGNSLAFAFTTGAAGTCPGTPTATPTTGAVGSSVTLTGTFTTAPTLVRFNTTLAAPVTTTPTGLTVLVPAGATTGPIHVYTAAGESHTISAFVVSTAPVPTITSFAPTSGNVGTSVTITGTNLLGVTSVRFNGVTATTIGTSTATTETATVPTGATTGKVSLTTAGGVATSLTDFTVTTAPVARTVSGFGFEPNSRVSGNVTVSSGTSACHSFVPVVIQKQKGGSWKWTDTTATTASGSFKTYIPPSNGKFRAKVNQITLANGVVCGGDVSNVVHS